ncbi:MAG: glycine--tRNA ligase subunit beta [Sulfuriferula sp.]|nr:glycine--tRNA ligase subunit beta [Sulfuriferula sp.]
MNASLLIELQTEELPPKSLQKLSDAFSGGIAAALKAQGFVDDIGAVTAYATPRRLAVCIPQVAAIQPPRQIERKGPAVAAGMKDGQPTPALTGFARSCGVDVSELTTMHDGKQECYVYRTTQTGEPLAQHLSGMVAEVLKKLPVAKLMRWGDSDVEFVRPVHGLIMLHGADVIAGELLGLNSGNVTVGHRFLSQGAITIAHADGYVQSLLQQGRIMASFAERRDSIRQQLAAAAGDAEVLWDEALLDEVTGLVEFPTVYAGTFSADFLEVPQACLILSMKQHQKYFPLADRSGNLLPRFLVVSNLQTDDPRHIIQGNERVLRARLSDARFFFDQDRKISLDSRVEKLAQVVYHNKLGSQLQRVTRMQHMASSIAALLHADTAAAARAAWLAKADLLTDMVGEFPELQGMMGTHYALHDGESADVAAAISAHYQPRFAGDALPQGPIAASVALADKLDTLVGIFGIGLIPTGDKDPFGLRRAALGVLRILIETPLALSLPALLVHAQAAFPAGVVADGVNLDVYGFMLDRMRHYLREQDFEPGEIEAVLANQPERMDLVLTRIHAVREFRKLPEAAALAAANKRVRNILKKAGDVLGTVNPALLEDGAEKELHARVTQLAPQVAAFVGAGDYTAALTALAGVRNAVDVFFDTVMVMAEDANVRQNRLALLHALGDMMNQVADISMLSA